MKYRDKTCYFCGKTNEVKPSEDCPPKSLVDKTFRRRIRSCKDCNHDLGLLDNIAVKWIQSVLGVDNKGTLTNMYSHQIRGYVPKLAIGLDENYCSLPLVKVSAYAIQAWLLKLALGLHVHIKGHSFSGVVSIMAAEFPQLQNKNIDNCHKLMRSIDIAPFVWSDIETVDNQSFSMRTTHDTAGNLIVWVGFYGVLSTYFHYYLTLFQEDGDYLEKNGATLWEAPYSSRLVKQTVINYLQDDEGLFLNETINIVEGFEKSQNKKLHYLALQALQMCADEQGISVRDFLRRQNDALSND